VNFLFCRAPIGSNNAMDRWTEHYINFLSPSSCDRPVVAVAFIDRPVRTRAVCDGSGLATATSTFACAAGHGALNELKVVRPRAVAAVSERRRAADPREDTPLRDAGDRARGGPRSTSTSSSYQSSIDRQLSIGVPGRMCTR
jgi:hypothetical protein